MVPSILIAALTCAVMIASVLFFPRIKGKRISLDTYWMVALLGAVVTVASGQIKLPSLWAAFTSNSAINPLKILILFLSMTVLSIFLDEVGFFKYLANKALLLAGKSQVKMFAVLYWTVSILTVFTSNDVIVLTFTPFICYFAKNAHIDPKPYLIAEFVAANTMSMIFLIGNPTNIYVATSYGVAFLDYFLVMALPTLASAAVSFGVLYLVFHRALHSPVLATPEVVAVKDKPLLGVGLFVLVAATVCLVVGPYFGVNMWLVAICAVGVLFLVALVLAAVRKRPPAELGHTLRRAPWQLVPFVLSMFVIVLALAQNGVTEKIGEVIGSRHTVWRYGILSFLSANVINNIPMSVLFCPIAGTLPEWDVMRGVYATVVGSNLGAFLTPIGALAGIMWMSLLKRHEVKMSYLEFVKYGAIVSLPSLAACLGTLFLVLR